MVLASVGFKGPQYWFVVSKDRESTPIHLCNEMSNALVDGVEFTLKRGPQDLIWFKCPRKESQGSTGAICVLF